MEKWRKDFESLLKVQSGIFNDAFKENKLNESQSKQDCATETLSESASLINQLPTLDEVRTALRLAKNKKSVGVDLIPNELLKNNVVAKILHKFFCECWKLQVIPDIWRRMILHPIPKEKGYVTNPLKYCGLSLQNCIYKIFSSIVNCRILNYLEYNNILSDLQNGFRRGRSCAQQIYSLFATVQRSCSKGQSIFASFIDFSKAFDLTDRNLLYYRLISYGIKGNILNLIKEMHTNTVSKIRLNGVYSGDLVSNIGVKQGDNQASTLFISFINYLLNNLSDKGFGVDIGDGTLLPLLAYADDVVLLAKSEDQLQEMLSHAH